MLSSDCNICHAPKFGKIEERTGAGGGFNERGIVEYKEKEESDGEYDDVSSLTSNLIGRVISSTLIQSLWSTSNLVLRLKLVF